MKIDKDDFINKAVETRIHANARSRTSSWRSTVAFCIGFPVALSSALYMAFLVGIFPATTTAFGWSELGILVAICMISIIPLIALITWSGKKERAEYLKNVDEIRSELNGN